MALKRPDGVIEAVHIQNGRIIAVRAFERRGTAYSDRTILDRATLLERLRQGKKFVTGQRRELWAGTFDTGAAVQIVGRDDAELISTRADAAHDELEGVPFF